MDALVTVSLTEEGKPVNEHCEYDVVRFQHLKKKTRQKWAQTHTRRENRYGSEITDRKKAERPQKLSTKLVRGIAVITKVYVESQRKYKTVDYYYFYWPSLFWNKKG